MTSNAEKLKKLFYQTRCPSNFLWELGFFFPQVAPILNNIQMNIHLQREWSSLSCITQIHSELGFSIKLM